MTNEELLRQDMEYHLQKAGSLEWAAQVYSEPENAAAKRRESLRHLQTAAAIKEVLQVTIFSSQSVTVHLSEGKPRQEPTGEAELE